jgi:hypothetical protein
MKLNDQFVIVYLGITIPLFLVTLLTILLSAAISDIVSYQEVFDGLQSVVPVV